MSYVTKKNTHSTITRYSIKTVKLLGKNKFKICKIELKTHAATQGAAFKASAFTIKNY